MDDYENYFNSGGKIKSYLIEGMKHSLLSFILGIASHEIGKRGIGEPNQNFAIGYNVCSTLAGILSGAMGYEGLRNFIKLKKKD